MHKALFIGDNHIDSLTPQNRVDNYMATSLAELEECMRIAEQRNVDYVVFLGDVFHRLETSKGCVNEVISILRGTSTGRSGIPKFVVPGNHDMRHTSNYLYNGDLGTLLLSGDLIYKPYIPEFQLGLCMFANDVLDRMREGKLTNHPAVIWAAHATITVKGFQDDHVLFKDLPLNPECKLVVAGHVHFPMEATRSDGKQFINPGSVGRTSAHEDHLDRDVKLLYVEYDETNLTHEYIKLNTSLPSEEVFNLNRIALGKEKKGRTQNFVRQANSLHTWTVGGGRYLSLRDAGVQKSIPETVISLAEGLLREVEDGKAKKDK